MVLSTSREVVGVSVVDDGEVTTAEEDVPGEEAAVVVCEVEAGMVVEVV